MEEKERHRIFEIEIIIHYKAVYNFLLNMVGRDVSKAEDLTQDTFARAFTKLDKYEPGTAARSWLFKVAYHIFVSNYRDKRRTAEVELDDRVSGLQSEVSEFTELVGELMHDPDLLSGVLSDEVQRALASLSADQRAILLRADLYDSTEKELAEEMGITQNTVKSRTRRARLNMIKSLQGFANGEYGITNTRNLE